MEILISWLIAALAIVVTALLLPGVEIGFMSALGAALVLGLLNAFLKPLLVALTLPINIVTLGLFSLVINALLVMIAASVIPGFRVSGFGAALLFSIVLSLVHLAIYSIMGR